MTDEELDKLEKEMEQDHRVGRFHDLCPKRCDEVVKLIAEVRRLRVIECDIHILAEDNDALLQANHWLRQQIAGHCDRIVAQSELFSEKAEKAATELWHYSSFPPGVAACGADVLNQRITMIREHVTCHRCLLLTQGMGKSI